MSTDEIPYLIDMLLGLGTATIQDLLNWYWVFQTIHPFFDGNKRAGFAAALHFLLSNGAAPVFNEEAAFSTITRVAAGEADIEELNVMMNAALQS